MDDLLKELRTYHEVSILKEPFTASRIEEFMLNIDVLYVEWCASYLVTVTHLPKKCRVICRLHGHELAGRWMKDIVWSKIDLMIFVNEHPLKLFHRAYPSATVNSTVIKEGVNTEKFTYPLGRGFGKRIGFVGYLQPRKDPLPVIDIMATLPDWSLYLRSDPSAYPQLTELCMKRMRELPNVHSIPRLEDMNGYYHRLDILVNNSTYESQGIAILEAMACGVYPLIRDWPEVPGVARELYPSENVYTSMDDCREKILNWVKLSPDEKRRISLSLRTFATKLYDGSRYVKEMREAIEVK